MGWLIAGALLLLLLSIPLGGRMDYDGSGFTARLLLGPISIRLYPRKKKEEKPEPEKEEPPNPAPASSQTAPQSDKKGSLSQFLPLLKLAVQLLGDLRRKIRVKELRLRLTLAGEDPCDLAVNYGRAWALAGNLVAQLERLFVIKKRDVEVQCDFAAEETTLDAHVAVTISTGRLLALTAVYGLRALKALWQQRKTENTQKGRETI